MRRSERFAVLQNQLLQLKVEDFAGVEATPPPSAQSAGFVIGFGVSTRALLKTCFEIWHDDFDADQAIPPHLGQNVVLHRPGKEAGQRKKTRYELQLQTHHEDSDDGNGGDDENEGCVM
ncbi:unnamed protein product [Phytophthora fragariaefolia]|uniref:Unnamed protein product n=1 Tax=Phytophthora fragariaefolia TaxID=1490495 RepID=A0A9W6YE59_9STRA|nr:unnamed protein product [Phytophthora fragariaefolia]